MAVNLFSIRKLLSDHGKEITLQGYGASTYDPETGTNTRSEDTPIKVIGYFFNYSKEEISYSTISANSRKLIFFPEDTSGNAVSKPNIGTHVESDTDTAVSISEVVSVSSGEDVLYYICRVE